MKLHKSNLYHNGSMQARDTERFCRGWEGKKNRITDNKRPSVFGVREIEIEQNCPVSDLNLGSNSMHDKLVRVKANALETHICRTDSVKNIISDLHNH